VRELAGAPGRYSFAHALIQHALYEDLGPTRRARAHRHVAKPSKTSAETAPEHGWVSWRVTGSTPRNPSS
jgi:hypothetical protein